MEQYRCRSDHCGSLVVARKPPAADRARRTNVNQLGAGWPVIASTPSWDVFPQGDVCPREVPLSMAMLLERLTEQQSRAATEWPVGDV